MENLEISRQFETTKEALFAAWTEPEQLKQWWKPLGKQLSSVENNLSEGGEVKYVFDEGSLIIDGKYEKVVANELLEYSWNWHLKSDVVEDAPYKLTVQFKGEGESSTISIEQTGFENAESVHPHKQGWEQGLDQLSQHLSGNSTDSPTSELGEQKPPVSGYNETPEQLKVGGE
jgi:uncharacterized protein YndB with AHSA1/START domain